MTAAGKKSEYCAAMLLHLLCTTRLAKKAKTTSTRTHPTHSYWTPVKALLDDINIQKRLVLFDFTSIPSAAYPDLSRLISDGEVVPDVIARLSNAASRLACWVNAVWKVAPRDRWNEVKPHFEALLQKETEVLLRARSRVAELERIGTM